MALLLEMLGTVFNHEALSSMARFTQPGQIDYGLSSWKSPPMRWT